MVEMFVPGSIHRIEIGDGLSFEELPVWSFFEYVDPISGFKQTGFKFAKQHLVDTVKHANALLLRLEGALDEAVFIEPKARVIMLRNFNKTR